MGGVWLTGGALQRSRELTKTIFCGHSLGIICALSSNKASKFCLISAEKKSPVINLRWQLPKSWAWVRSNICPKRDSYGRGKSPLNVLDLVSTNKIWGAMAWRSSSSSRRTNNNSHLHVDVLLIHLYPFESIQSKSIQSLTMPQAPCFTSAYQQHLYLRPMLLASPQQADIKIFKSFWIHPSIHLSPTKMLYSDNSQVHWLPTSS